MAPLAAGLTAAAEEELTLPAMREGVLISVTVMLDLG
jgi:hypothetical protein